MQYILPKETHILTTFAANYGCNVYGQGTYNNNTCQTQDNGSPTGGGLADTGYDIIIPAALGLALIVAGLILLTKRLIRRKKAHQK